MKIFAPLFAVALALSAVPASAGWVSRTNAALNTPESKAALLARTCASAAPTDVTLCERWKATGVPNSDIRYAIGATAVVVGGVAGGYLFFNPGVIGQHTFHVLGWTPGFKKAVAIGAGTALGVAGGALAVDHYRGK